MLIDALVEDASVKYSCDQPGVIVIGVIVIRAFSPALRKGKEAHGSDGHTRPICGTSLSASRAHAPWACSTSGTVAVTTMLAGEPSSCAWHVDVVMEARRAAAAMESSALGSTVDGAGIRTSSNDCSTNCSSALPSCSARCSYSSAWDEVVTPSARSPPVACTHLRRTARKLAGGVAGRLRLRPWHASACVTRRERPRARV